VTKKCWKLVQDEENFLAIAQAWISEQSSRGKWLWDQVVTLDWISVLLSALKLIQSPFVTLLNSGSYQLFVGYFSVSARRLIKLVSGYIIHPEKIAQITD